MNVRNIGVLGYGGVLPVVALLMGRLFSRTPASDEQSFSPRLAA